LASAALEQIAAAGGKNAEHATSQKAYVDRLYAASGAADCGQMDQMYASVVNESASDLEKLGSIMKLYRRLGCTESDVYFAAAEHAHKLQPTSESAAGCAQMCLKKNDLNGALDYYKQALSMATEDEDKADYLYRMATIYVSLNNLQQGASYAYQALEIAPEDGRCYLVIGICYAGAKIYDDPILARSVFWVACDMFAKAKQVDSSCSSDANKLIATYRQYFPSKEDVFFHKELNDGASFRVGGWINKSTICRSKAE
jgi:tetratricopeptide (TPR) repeat protein